MDVAPKREGNRWALAALGAVVGFLVGGGIGLGVAFAIFSWVAANMDTGYDSEDFGTALLLLGVGVLIGVACCVTGTWLGSRRALRNQGVSHPARTSTIATALVLASALAIGGAGSAFETARNNRLDAEAGRGARAIFRESQSDMLPPTTSLLRSLESARKMIDAIGSYSTVSAKSMNRASPGLAFVMSPVPSKGPEEVSIYADGRGVFAAAALSYDGACYWIRAGRADEDVSYGRASAAKCTGRHAARATYTVAEAVWGIRCDPSYPDEGVCIPPPPPDLVCADIRFRDFRVQGSDPHGFDDDGNGRGCET